MAQLYDCFADGGLTPLDEIYRQLSQLDPVCREVEMTALAEILPKPHGRVFAENIKAERDSPPFANAAVDGYAFARADAAAGGSNLTIAAVIEAGDSSPDPLPKYHAAVIFTGAMMPTNADTVLMHEDAPQDIDTVLKDWHEGTTTQVTIPDAINPYDNCRPAGDDVKAGEIVIAKGTVVTPREIALCASLGLAHIPLLPKLKLALLSTGDELCLLPDSADTARDLPVGKIYDANRPMLSALLMRQGIEVTDGGIVKDEISAVRAALDTAAVNHDVIVTSGAMSEGRKDYIRHLLQTEGSLHFLRAAVKPGRPVGIGRWRDTAIIALPGNPVASFTIALVIALPMLQRLQGRPLSPPVGFPAIADFTCKSRPHRREYVRAVITGRDEASGLPILARHGKTGAGVISSLVGVDGFAVIAEDAERITSGDRVEYLPFHQF